MLAKDLDSAFSSGAEVIEVICSSDIVSITHAVLQESQSDQFLSSQILQNCIIAVELAGSVLNFDDVTLSNQGPVFP